MWFYLPKNRSQVHRTRKVFYHDTPYKQNRRLRYAVFPKLREAFFFCLFMIIAFRVGTWTIILFADFKSIRAASYLSKHVDPIEMVTIQNAEKTPNIYMMIILSMDKNGNKLLNGKQYSNTELDKQLEKYLSIFPKVVVGLVIDKNCEMVTVKKLYERLRRIGLLRINHIVDRNSKLIEMDWSSSWQ